MPVASDRISKAERIDLKRRIVARLKVLARMLDFRVGDRAGFPPDGCPPPFGSLTRGKTVTVAAECGEHRTVSPHRLLKVMDVAEHGPSRNALTQEGCP